MPCQRGRISFKVPHASPINHPGLRLSSAMGRHGSGPNAAIFLGHKAGGARLVVSSAGYSMRLTDTSGPGREQMMWVSSPLHSSTVWPSAIRQDGSTNTPAQQLCRQTTQGNSSIKSLSTTGTSFCQRDRGHSRYRRRPTVRSFRRSVPIMLTSLSYGQHFPRAVTVQQTA